LVKNYSPKDQKFLPYKKHPKSEITKEERAVGAAGWLSVDRPVDRQPNWHIAIGLGRPATKGQTQFWTVGRPVGRPTKNREQPAFSRSTGRSTDKRAQPCTSWTQGPVDQPVDRPSLEQSWSTGPVDW